MKFCNYTIAIRTKVSYSHKYKNNQCSYMSDYVISILDLQIEPNKSK